LFGLGLAILANSRPYEGLVLSVPAIVFLVAKRWRAGVPALARQLAPAAAVLALSICGMTFYFWRVTGNPMRMPYQVYTAEYAAAPAFLVQRAPATPAYRDASIRDANLSFAADYRRYASLSGFARLGAQRLAHVALFYLGPLVLVTLLMAPALLRSPKLRLLVIAAGTVSAALLVTVPFQPHYAAPIGPILLALATGAFRALWLLQRKAIAIGRPVVLAAPIVCAIGQILIPSAPPSHSRLEFRPQLVRQLEQRGGRHLVFVRYESPHALSEEWVFNTADIDRSSIVWARDLGPAQNRLLMEYYPLRKAWVLWADRNPPQIANYPD
jgi:hypothetical protein